MAATKPHNPFTAADDRPTPLVVRPRVAWRLLDCGNSFGYGLIAANEIASYRDGRARKITVESIHRYIQRKIAERSAP